MPRRLITERHVLDAARSGSGRLVVAPGTLVTPLARDAAREHGVAFVERTPEAGTASASAPSPAPPKTLALGCDHAGFPYKAALKTHAEALGFAVTDVGTDSEASVDYPDYAFAVARLVQQGAVRFGLMIDGVGVG